MLSVQNLSKAYGQQQVLTDINFSLAPGEIVAIIGPSGGGKSTLLRALSLLDPPNKGVITVDEEQYSFPAKGKIMRPGPWPKLTLVFQQLFLWPHLTVRQNIELPLKHIKPDEREDLIAKLFRTYAIDAFEDRYPNQISIGQRQRVAFARAVALRPTYLLLDEVTSALDVEHIQTVLGHLRELARGGTAIILVTHLIGFAKHAADQVIFMEEGQIVESGGAHILVAPQTKRLALFLSLVEVASPEQIDRDDKWQKALQTSYVADAILKRLKDGFVPAEADILCLEGMPLIDNLRARVFEADIPWIAQLVRHTSERLAGLGCSLLKRFTELDDIATVFEDIWPIAPPYLKNRILWRLMDFQKTAEKYHDEFVEFVFDKWPVFRDFNLTFYGEAEDATANIMSRLMSKDEPVHKLWLYLCCMPEVVDDPKLARAVIENFKINGSPQTRNIAERLLARFWPFPDDRGPRRAQKFKKEETSNFLIDAVFAALQNGKIPAENESDLFNRLPFIDLLRNRVERSDIDQWVIQGITEDRIEYAGLCLSLLRKFDTEQEIAKYLKTRWETAGPFLKGHLMWRILDDKALPQEWHERIFSFILENPKAFHSASLKFLGTPENVVEKAKARYRDPQFTVSKKWAYLCRVAGVALYPDEAKKFLQSALKDKHAFTRHVAQVLLDRYYVETK